MIVKRWLIVSDKYGLYLSTFCGKRFWSSNSKGQTAAITFESVELAQRHIKEWPYAKDAPREGIQFKEVIADLGEFASQNACVKEGLSPWNVIKSEQH